MKFNKPSQLVLATAASLLAATLVTACSQFTQTLTIDFVYVATNRAAGANNYGNINVFEIDSESGHMRQIPASPFPSGGRNPVAEAVSADYSSLFVVNEDDNSIVQFIIGSDGKLYPYATVNTPGILPLAVAVNKSNLFVVDTFQPLSICSTAKPCSGSIAVYPLTAGSATSSTCTATVCMGSPVANPAGSGTYWPLLLSGSQAGDVIVPTAVNVATSGSTTYVYVSAYDSATSPSVGYVFGFAVGSTGALTPLNGSPWVAGVQPSAIASDASGSYLYVTDYAQASVLGFNISAANGALAAMTGGMGGGNEFRSGNQPSAIVVNPAYPYVYVANALDATITAYSMSNGRLTRLGDISGGGTYAAGSQPMAIGIDPSTHRYLYTANFLSDNVSGFQLSATDGSLVVSQFSPYSTNPQPLAVAAIPHNGTGAGTQ